jgi:hypothetical protein
MADLLSLAERASERAGHMGADVEMMEIELVSMEAASERKWGEYQDSPSDLSRRNHIVFMDRKDALRRSIQTTREDAEHYRACAAALRALAADGEGVR